MSRAARRSRLNYVNGGEARYAGAPDEHHAYARAPRLRELRLAAGISDGEAAELLKEQGYGLGTLRALEDGREFPVIVVSRITAALGLSHAEAKGEL